MPKEIESRMLFAPISGTETETFPHDTQNVRTSEILRCEEKPMIPFLRYLWTGDDGQDIAEYAVMLAVILVLVVGTVRLVGSNANNAFSDVASSMQ